MQTLARSIKQGGPTFFPLFVITRALVSFCSRYLALSGLRGHSVCRDFWSDLKAYDERGIEYPSCRVNWEKNIEQKLADNHGGFELFLPLEGRRKFSD